MREQEVLAQLAEVYDPELDRPLTELGFIAGVTIAGGHVTVRFRLPTFWCAANFAYMMAADIRSRVSELPWVEQVTVQLQDHFVAGEINEGIAAGHSFRETFPELAAGELEELRAAFRRKAFLSRQERVLQLLLRLGRRDEEIVAMRLGELQAHAGLAPQERHLVDRYLSARREWGLPTDPGAPAFCQPEGEPLDGTRFREHLQEARRTRLSMVFNTAFCCGLLKTRYGDSDNLIPLEGLHDEGSPIGRV